MSALDDLERQLKAANTTLHRERVTGDAAAAVPAPVVRRPRRRLALAGTLAVLTAAITVGGLALQQDDGGPAGLPGAVSAMADRITAKQGVLHVVSTGFRTRTADGGWTPAGPGRDEAWIDLDRGGWRDRVVEDGRVTADELQRPDGTELTQRKNGAPRVDTATRGLPQEQLLPRQAWGGFVGARLRNIGDVEEVDRTTVDGRPAVVVREQDVGDRDYRYVLDEETGAVLQVIQRDPLRDGKVFETRVDVERWEILPDSPALRERLTTLDRIGDPAD
jgi:hypothetical protein